jgi:hypothetical protein
VVQVAGHVNVCQVPFDWHWKSWVPVPQMLWPGMHGPWYVHFASVPESSHTYPGVQSLTLRTSWPPVEVVHQSICVAE